MYTVSFVPAKEPYQVRTRVAVNCKLRAHRADGKSPTISSAAISKMILSSSSGRTGESSFSISGFVIEVSREGRFRFARMKTR